MCLSIFYSKFVEYLVSSKTRKKQPITYKNKACIISYKKVIFKTSHDLFQLIKKAYRYGTLKLLNLLSYALFLETTATPTRATTAARIAMPAMSAV